MGSAFFFLEPVGYNINKFRTAAKCEIFMPSMRKTHSEQTVGGNEDL